jgi:hypothetical protein
MRAVHKEKTGSFLPLNLLEKGAWRQCLRFRTMTFAQKSEVADSTRFSHPALPRRVIHRLHSKRHPACRCQSSWQLPLFQQGLKSDLFNHRFVHFLFLRLFHLVVSCRQRFFFTLQHLQHMIAVAGFDRITDFI